jgi:hypothetical protein
LHMETIFSGMESEILHWPIFYRSWVKRTLITFLEMKPTILDDSFKFVILDAGGALKAWRRRQMISDSIVPVLCRRFIIWEGRDIDYSMSKTEQYGHLSQFSRSSTLDLQTLLWRRVFSIAKDAGKPMYISTDGRTVPWLHVRIEDNPKYYKYSLWFTCAIMCTIFFCCTYGYYTPCTFLRRNQSVLTLVPTLPTNTTAPPGRKMVAFDEGVNTNSYFQTRVCA